MPRTISDEERRSRIGLRHRLIPNLRTDDVAAIVDDLVGLHSSDPATVFLSAAVRMQNPSRAVLETALYDHRTLVRVHLMRRTLWVTSRKFAANAHGSTTVRYLPQQQRMTASFIEEAGISEDGQTWVAAAADAIERTVAERGPMSTKEVGLIHPDLAVDIVRGGGSVKAHGRVLLMLAFEGRIVRGRSEGSWITSQYLWERPPGGSLFDDVEPDRAAALSLDHYLRRFGPATLEDITWWFGWPKGIARRALTDARADGVSVTSGPAFVAASDPGPSTGAAPWVALLPGLDPTVMGWKRREWYLDESLIPMLFDRNGNAGPTVWMDGRVVGGWSQLASGSIAYRLFTDEAKARTDEVEAMAARLKAFYGDTRHKPRFAAPLQRELYSSGQ